MSETKSNEFTRPLVLAQIGDRESRHKIAAEEEERSALAKRLRLQGIDRLEGELAVRRVRGGAALKVSGSLTADVTQTCIATLTPLPVQVQDSFLESFALEHKGSEATEIDLSLAEEDGIEPLGPELYANGTFDLGELLVQLLAERLDPYPRHADAPSAEGEWGAAANGESEASPFAELARKLKQ
ncbi:DUF177 domain-containing protein [Aquibaculum sediminis]|uniref:DUF177 domain-containing protein n=1 Tax=Aquibaculum sediminis TaxID=3231907 RepID=UPI0034553FC0